ncbi:anthranilate phosphoribosyltransferase [Corallincola holothuriorum]|uniref:Anthranilate phosphoribosyltransferase n=1 Tax=Corallincola holothuriorum TaxID=2282215 RepID=A0A368NK63_9GAMM|nr:anthranilate phosphoribosyltransferase [Corallincola holothuriorum]RCU50490.1 anthranilate phosphoribosyltransferase [Corallincola holothuriorum]
MLESLYQQQDLSREQTAALFSEIIRGEMDPVVISSLLTALKIKGETPQEIAGAADALRTAAASFPKPDYPVADIVGTGGDGHHTINISTTSVFVAAACGLKVCKHGNRSVSSKSGSADLLERLGVNLTMSPDIARKCLDNVGCCFIFAPQYHGGIRHAMPVRKALATRTLFNVLGPLINPAQPEYMVLGVYSPALVKPIAEALQYLGVKHALVVHGSGLDEIALHGPTDVAEVTSDGIKEYSVTAEDFGLKQHPLDALKGGEPEQNAVITRAILAGQGTEAQRSAVAANVGALLYVSGLASSLKQGALLAIEAMDSAKPLAIAEGLATVSNEQNGDQ